MDEMCDKNSIFACFDAMITQKSPWLPFMISFFIWPWRRSRILKTSQTMKMAARATAARARDSKHQSDHRRTNPAAGSQINVTL